MALGTVTLVRKWHDGGGEHAIIDVVMPASNADDGDVLTADMIPGAIEYTIDHVDVGIALVSGMASAYLIAWDPATSKLIGYTGAASGTPLAQETAATDMSTWKVRLHVIGQ